MTTDAFEIPFEPALAQRIKAVSNVFEVGAPTADYSYIENLGDGRGYTITQYGLVTNELEVGWVIERHAQLIPDSQLTRYLPHLPPHDTGTDMEKLSGFEEAWQLELQNGQSLIQACDEIADRLYFTPARQAAKKIGVATPIGHLVFYDTILQHGGGDDPDSFGAILERSIHAVGRPEGAGEAQFLIRFLSERRAVLNNPANSETADVWRQSVSRVEALENLLRQNPSLAPPILVASSDVRIEVS